MRHQGIIPLCGIEEFWWQSWVRCLNLVTGISVVVPELSIGCYDASEKTVNNKLLILLTSKVT